MQKERAKPDGAHGENIRSNPDKSQSLGATVAMPAFITYLHISRREAEIVNGYLQAKSTAEFQGENHTISHTAVFPDGKQMDVKCCGAQDDCSWAEAVLFDENGCELCCSEGADQYEGTWELEYQNRRYAVIVRICG